MRRLGVLFAAAFRVAEEALPRVRERDLIGQTEGSHLLFWCLFAPAVALENLKPKGVVVEPVPEKSEALREQAL